MSLRSLAAALLAFFFLLAAGLDANAAPVEQPGKDSRCAVCGMFVAKYTNWVAQIRLTDGPVQWFDGPKDMLAYYFDPVQYGAKSRQSVGEVLVKDYYSLNWIDGKKAFYVTGSDVHGPMGHEFVPFASREAAQSFMKDHGGDRVWSFAEITPEKVQALRTGSMMKGGGSMPMKGSSPMMHH
ncbi:MAG: nitrous oxide reductase accessory protein NosL [Desulfobacteraceae bacterium]|nr:nitrous oxide reductase accessory protein NosL [Desulfobacteraceae bacterium]